MEEHASHLGATIQRKSICSTPQDGYSESIAQIALPPFLRAARDAYAAAPRNLAHVPAKLRVIGEIKAGADSHLQVGPGQAVSIMTGAAAPPGADAVVMVEYTTLRGQEVEVHQTIEPGVTSYQ